MTPLKISICIPAYEAPSLLFRALSSVVSQFGANFEIEIIVTDDSSSDSVERVVRQFEEAGSLIRFERNTPPLGAPENWNKALHLATGEIVILLHHDDFFLRSDYLATLANIYTDSPTVGMTMAQNSWIRPHQSSRLLRGPTNLQIAKLNAGYRLELFGSNFASTPSAVSFRRNLLQDYDPRFKYLLDVDHYLAILIRKKAQVELLRGQWIGINVDDPTQITNAVVLKNPAGIIAEWNTFLDKWGADSWIIGWFGRNRVNRALRKDGIQ